MKKKEKGESREWRLGRGQKCRFNSNSNSNWQWQSVSFDRWRGRQTGERTFTARLLWLSSYRVTLTGTVIHPLCSAFWSRLSPSSTTHEMSFVFFFLTRGPLSGFGASW